MMIAGLVRGLLDALLQGRSLAQEQVTTPAGRAFFPYAKGVDRLDAIPAGSTLHRLRQLALRTRP